MRTIIATLLSALLVTPAFAQDSKPLQVTGSLTTAGQTVDTDTNSSKVSEYRDLSRRFFVPNLTLLVRNPENGWVLDLMGVNVGLRDQTVQLSARRPGRVGIDVTWIETPHLYSNKALSPYIDRGNGLFTVPSTVPITFKKLGTAAADIPGVLASDLLIADYQTRTLRPIALGTQAEQGRLAGFWASSNGMRLDLAWQRRNVTGSKSTFGPIGDRPPRTLNIQLAEPVNYRTDDVTVAAEHTGKRLQVRAEYLYSDFANAVDTMRWQNVYANPAPGAEYDLWDRVVGVYGARPLPPDNQYHSALAQGGLNLAGAGFLTASFGVGRLEQNSDLLPYATGAGLLTNRTLPRTSAQAKITTRHLSADYVVALMPRVTMRAFVRSNTMDNETPSSQWQYVTSDTYGLTGGVSYVNKRVNLPAAVDRMLAGGEFTWRLPKGKSSLAVGLERDALTRAHREADTTETRLRLSWRARPRAGVSLHAKYLWANREADGYHWEVTREGYWYALTEANDQNNPQRTFDNHPDMRRYDVSDRLRQQADASVTISAIPKVSISAYLRYRTDDYDSDVTSIQPLLNTGLPDASASTPGQQLGWLTDKRLRYGLDFFTEPTERVTFSAYVGYDKGTGDHRSMEFNENNKQNPSAIAMATLGPWTRASSIWNSDYEDRTLSGGVGTRLVLAPERATFSADYTWSLATVAIGYNGFGQQNWDGTALASNHEFFFTSPDDVTEDLKVLDLRMDFPCRQLTFIVGYRYEVYDLADWQQGAEGPWVERVGADTLLRDTSRSFQWGNRLFNFGTYLAPSYKAHVAWVGARVGF
jgi:hypothetical protein